MPAAAAEPADDDDQRAIRERTLRTEWIKAMFLVALGALAAMLLELTHADTAEAMYVLKSLIFAALGLITKHPMTLGLVNAAVAALLLVVRRDPESLGARATRRLVVQLNRSAGHLEALFAWLIVVIWWAPTLWLQIDGVLLIVIIGPLAVTAVTWGPHGTLSAWRLLFPAALTITGLVLVAVIVRHQWTQLAPLVGLVLAGLVPRTAWSLWQERSLHVEATAGEGWPRFVDRLIAALAVGAVIIVPLHAFKPGHRASVENLLARERQWRSCDPPAAPAPAADFALFIVSDSQFHELDGQRSGFHMDMVDRAVPVSVRPVELDLLSAATLTEFADVYQALRATRPTLAWTHLGDSADVGCVAELDRFRALAPRFGPDHLAAVIPGNHDVSFLGNLAWHPDWDAACPSGELSPELARSKLAELMPPRAGRTVSTDSDFLASVAVIGALGAEPVIGVFLDTTDVPWDGVGIQGAQGGISDEQVAWVRATLAHYPTGRVIVLAHHPLDQWTKRSRRKLDELAEVLGPRLWGLVTAHTHLAARREHELAGRTVPEFIVGSTIDPPQEASLLEGTADGHLALRTIQAVHRDAMACPDEPAPTVSAATCRAVFARLHAAPACEPLFSLPHALAASRHCGARADDSSLEDNADSPGDLDCIQEARAADILACLGVGGGSADSQPLHDAGLPARIAAATAQDPDTAVCLSWAASVMQAHKRDRWSFAHAIDFALEDSATYGELEVRWPR